MSGKQRFDDWPKRYDRWFETPVGRAVLKYETALVLEMLRPGPGERILDAGSGTGIFTREFVALGAEVVGLDISLAMLMHASKKSILRKAPGDNPSVAAGTERGKIRQDMGNRDPFGPRPRGKESPVGYHGVAGDMETLPFADRSFDKSVSVAALEFIADEKRAVAELFRITKPGGVVVVATLNSLSPWAARRREEARRNPGSIFSRVFFRSPEQLLAAAPVNGMVRTVVHFGKEEDPATFAQSEEEGEGSQTGAFVAARWPRP